LVETVEKTHVETVSMLSQRLKQAEIVLTALQVIGFGWLLILLFQVLNGPPSVVYNPRSYGSDYGIWIQGVQFSQLIVALTIGGAASLLRSILSWIPGIIHWLRRR